MSDLTNGKAAPAKGGSSHTNGSDSNRTERKRTSPKGASRVGSTHARRVTIRGKAKKVLPSSVLRAHDLGLHVIPQAVVASPDGKFRKVPPFKWKQYQTKRPSLGQLIAWQEKYNPPMWAFIAGKVLFALDFDPEDGGVETFHRLGLRSHIHSSGGGEHVYIRMPSWPVVTQTRGKPGSPFPGMEVKAGGSSLITFYGSNPDGTYRSAHGGDPYLVEDLPMELAEHIRHPAQRKERRNSRRTVEVADRPLPAALQLALSRLGNRQLREVEEGRQWEACCPVHDEKRPSFGIGLGADRLIVANCFGCGASIEDIGGALGIDPSEFSRRPWDSAWKEEPAYLLGSATPLEKVRWLWRYVVPIGKPTIFEGDPAKGKSVVTSDIAGRVTMGRSMPDGPAGLDGPYAVLIISGEDDYADTIKPRLLAAGVDEDRVILLTLERDESGNVVPLTLPTGLNRIRAAIEQAKRDRGLIVKLIIIDPITNFLAERTQTGIDASVRRALAPLSELSADLDVALILVRHLNKQGELKAMYRGGGSIAFVALSRSAYVFDRHPEDPDVVVMAPVKANLVPRPFWKSRTYELESHDVYEVPMVKWGSELLDLDADTLLKGLDSRVNSADRQEAKSLMQGLLERGPQDAKVMKEERDKAGISERIWKAVKKELGVISEQIKEPDGIRTQKWVWRLPSEFNGDGGVVIRIPEWRMKDDG